MTRRTLNVGSDRFTVGPWHEHPDVAYITVAPSAHQLTNPYAVTQCLEQLGELGYRAAVTSALRGSDAHVFEAAGFVRRERLHVLRHELGNLPLIDRTGARLLRRGRRRDRRVVLDVDERAFERFWALGSDGLDEALNATASVRFRVASDRDVFGYAVTGRSGEVGYLQRLAVDPVRSGGGIGTALVLDALHWLRARHGRFMLVNTQESNAAALRLYLRLGFNMVDEHLTVLQWPGE